MNIAFFTYSRVHPTAGGVERVTYNLSESLRTRGHKVFSFFYNGREDGVNNFTIPLPDKNNSTGKRLDYLIKSLNLDIIIDQYGRHESLTHRCIEADVKILRCFHTTTNSPGHSTKMLLGNFNFDNLKDSLINVLFWINTPRRLLMHDKILYTRSRGVDRLILLDEHFQLPKSINKEIVTAIPNGIPATQYTPGEKKKQILFVGRVIHNPKNIRFLLKLWRALYREYIDWEFIICGDGPDLPIMKKYVQRHGIERIHFKGVVNPEPYYKDAAILVLPSFYEGFSMSLSEAMQHGCVPVLFDVSTAFHKVCYDPNRLDENGNPRRCGVIVKAMDDNAYLEACRLLMSDENLRQQLSLAAFNRMKDFEQDKITNLWEKLFAEVLQDK